MLFDNPEWTRRYRSPSQDLWQGRVDPEAKRFHEVIRCADLKQGFKAPLETLNFGFIGFSSDEGVKRNQGRQGASGGPDAIRKSLAKLPVNTPQNWRFFDVGNIACEDGNLEAAQECLGNTIHHLLSQNIFPIGLGGGHEMAWGHYLGLRQALPKNEISIVNFDSHFDMRPLDEEGRDSSGTPFLQMALDCQKRKIPFHYTCLGIQNQGNTKALFHTAEDFGVRYAPAEAFHLMSPEKDRILETAISSARAIYLTICLDVFSAPFAPGVSAPQPLGLFPYHVISQLKKLARSGRVIGFDIAEMNPIHDQDEITARLAASLIWVFVHEVVSDHYAQGPLTCCEIHQES